MQLGIALLYLFFGMIIHHFIISHGIVSVIWPGSGLALAALLIGGKRYIWGILLGSLLLNALSNDSLWAVGGFTLANVLEAYLGFWLLVRYSRSALFLDTLPDYLRLIALGGGVASIAGALIGSMSLLLAGVITPSYYFENVSHWWMGDVLGVVLITPLILGRRETRLAQFIGKQSLEVLLLVGIMFVVSQIVFLDWFHEFFSDTPRGYLIFFFVTWVAIRLGPRGATFVVLMIAVQALSGAYQEIGFFAHDIARANLHNYWGYMLTLSVVGMAITTNAKASKDALQALQLKDSALNAAANGIVITNIDGNIEWINNAFSHLTGFSLNEAYGRNPRELVKSGKHDNAFYKSMWDTILANKVWHGELISSRKDGSLYDEEMTITPLVNEQNEITHFVAVKQNIAERKRVEAKLVESETRLRTIIENEPECIKIIDAQGRLMQMNPAGLAMIEADSLEQVVGYPMLDIIIPEYHTAYAKLQQRVLAGEAMQMEFEVLGFKGGRRWLETHAVPMQDSGETVHLAVTRDITERKQAEGKLHLAASVFTHAREGIMITAADGTIIDVNDTFSRITGYSRDEVLEKNPRILNSGRQGKEFYAAMWRDLIENGHWYGEVWNRRKNGKSVV